jgi:LexA-binding, inner membrane-associated putative hydrolase
MDLPTHFVFAFAIGLIFFDNPEIALLIALASLFPDLDREYWFIPKKRYADEQIHRAGLHNVFIMCLTYIISPYFSLGIFLHILQDSFTTVKDRGVEWFYPVTRLVKRGLFDGDGKQQPLDPKEKIYFYQEDSRGLVKKADPDLREYGCSPVPWRRVYGFAQNSQILDRGFLYGSIAVILIWHLAPGNNLHLLSWSTIPSGFYLVISVGFASILTLFVAGELDRRDKSPSRKLKIAEELDRSDKSPSRKLMKLNFIKYLIFAFGLILFSIWLILFRDEIIRNVHNIISNPVAFSMEVTIVPVVVILMIMRKAKGRGPVVV